MNRISRRFTPQISFSHQADEDFIDSWLTDYVLREGLAYMHGAWWHTEARVRDIPTDALVSASVHWNKEAALLFVRDILVNIVISGSQCYAYAYSSSFSHGDFQAVMDQVKGWLPPKAQDVPETVQMVFRYRGGRRGCSKDLRDVDVPMWLEISDNYPSRVREQLALLFDGFVPGDGGRLILFHGPPGTGKTYILRALAREWRKWCDLEYITDPEAFFGDAEYMMNVLVDTDEDSSEADKRWRLLVIEDAGELLARDAKAQRGQALSRLLNLGEGLLGQGLRILILITSNEDIRTLNEAVSRPGRTAAAVEFGSMTVDECNVWLGKHDPEKRTVAVPMMLAELFAMVAGA